MCAHANITDADKQLSSFRKIETHLAGGATLATAQVKDTEAKCYFLLSTIFRQEFSRLQNTA